MIPIEDMRATDGATEGASVRLLHSACLPSPPSFPCLRSCPSPAAAAAAAAPDSRESFDFGHYCSAMWDWYLVALCVLTAVAAVAG